MENSFILYFAGSLPFWAIPVGIILLEVGNRNRIRQERLKMFTAFFVAICLFALAGAFIYYGGYKDAQSIWNIF